MPEDVLLSKSKICEICGWEIKTAIAYQRICTVKNGRPSPKGYKRKESLCQRKAENKRRMVIAERKKEESSKKDVTNAWENICLKCDKLFHALSKYNRICPECTNVNTKDYTVIGGMTRTMKKFLWNIPSRNCRPTTEREVYEQKIRQE